MDDIFVPLWIIVVRLRSFVEDSRQFVTVFSFRRSSVKVFACESTSTVAVNVCCRAAVAGQRRLSLSSPPSGCDVRCILSTEFDDCFEELLHLAVTGLCSLDYIAHNASRFVVYTTVNLSKPTVSLD